MGEEFPPFASHEGGVGDIEMDFDTFSIEPNDIEVIVDHIVENICTFPSDFEVTIDYFFDNISIKIVGFPSTRKPKEVDFLIPPTTKL